MVQLLMQTSLTLLLEIFMQPRPPYLPLFLTSWSQIGAILEANTTIMRDKESMRMLSFSKRSNKNML